MSEIRFSYNPFTNDFIESDSSHAVAIYNKGNQKRFDEYIRGIIVGETLYLRTYYPFEFTDGLSVTELRQKSFELLEYYKRKILFIVEEYDLGKIDDIKFNVENDLLTGIGLANI